MGHGIAGAVTYDADRIFDTWANPLDLVEPGLGIKQFPCCGSTHMAISMMLELRAKYNLTPGGGLGRHYWEGTLL